MSNDLATLREALTQANKYIVERMNEKRRILQAISLNRHVESITATELLLSEALAILDRLEAQESREAGPVACVYVDADSLKAAQHLGHGKTELTVLKQGRCTVPLYTSKQALSESHLESCEALLAKADAWMMNPDCNGSYINQLVNALTAHLRHSIGA